MAHRGLKHTRLILRLMLAFVFACGDDTSAVDAAMSDDASTPGDAPTPEDAPTPDDSSPGSDSGMGGIDTGPTGDGIAARYPGDEGIEADPAVLFADDFESYGSADELDRAWNGGVYRHVRIATEPDLVFAGSQSLEFRGPAQSEELSNTVARWLEEEQDVVYVRFYARYDDNVVIATSYIGLMR